VAATVAVSLDLLSPSQRQSYQELAIFPQDVDIPLAIVGTLWGMDEFDTEELAQRLDDLSLLELHLRTTTISLHNVMRSYLANHLTEPAALHARLLDRWGDPYQLPDSYAWRYISYHQIQAGRREELRKLLLDFNWLQAKLEGLDVNALITDFDYLPKDKDMRLVQGALRLSAHVLVKDGTQLAGQLLGRLPWSESEAIQALLEVAKQWNSAPWLRPLAPGLTPPGGPLLRILTGHTGGVEGVAVTSDDRLALSVSWNTVKVWEIDTGQELRTLRGSMGEVFGVAVTPDGRLALSASEDHTVKVWDLETGQEVHTLKGHINWVWGMAVTPDSRLALSASRDSTVKVWDLETGQELRTLTGHTGGVKGVAVTPDGRLALSASGDHTVRVWDIESSSDVHILKEHTGEVSDIAVTPGDRYALSASQDGTVKVWDIQAGQIIHTFKGHQYGVKSVTVTPDGRRALSASLDSTVKVWDLESRQELRTFTDHTGQVFNVAVTPDGQRALSTAFDGVSSTVKVWDIETGRVVCTVHANDVVNEVAVMPDSRFIICATYRKLMVWDIETDEEVLTLRGDPNIWSNYQSVVVAPDGRFVLYAAGDNTVKVWDGREVHSLKGSTHTGLITDLTVTSDGRFAVSASVDRTVKVWDLETGREMPTLKGHTDEVGKVEVTPDGRLVLSASEDHTVKVWDLETGRVLATFSAEAPIRTCAIASSNRTIIVGDASGRVHILRLEGIG
jgi:WD40 repeat protein